VKLKEETEEGGEVCRLLSSWGCPRPHFGWSRGRRGREEMGLGGGSIGWEEKKIECSLALGAAYEARGWRPRAATSVSARRSLARVGGAWDTNKTTRRRAGSAPMGWHG
jgi:hypothetical protein